MLDEADRLLDMGFEARYLIKIFIIFLLFFFVLWNLLDVLCTSQGFNLPEKTDT